MLTGNNQIQSKFIGLLFGISLSTKLPLKLTILVFWIKFDLKDCSGLKQKKLSQPLNSAYSKKSRYQISVQTNNFGFMDQIFLKRVFTTKNVNTTTKFYIFELVQVTNFSLNWQFWFFGPNLPERGIPVGN